jgi:hypothetical protein
VTQTAGGRLIGELPLAGGGGEPVDLPRTLASHGVAARPARSGSGRGGRATSRST